MDNRTLKPRPTTYAGIRMRSRLEAHYAKSFDEHDVAWEYEPNCFASVDGQYLPDFGIGRPGSRTYVEVKPENFDLYATQARMEVVWASEPNATLIIMSAGDIWMGRKGEWRYVDGEILDFTPVTECGPRPIIPSIQAIRASLAKKEGAKS